MVMGARSRPGWRAGTEETATIDVAEPRGVSGVTNTAPDSSLRFRSNSDSLPELAPSSLLSQPDRSNHQSAKLPIACVPARWRAASEIGYDGPLTAVVSVVIVTWPVRPLYSATPAGRSVVRMNPTCRLSGTTTIGVSPLQ